jgi:hypothetical protein
MDKIGERDAAKRQLDAATLMFSKTRTCSPEMASFLVRSMFIRPGFMTLAMGPTNSSRNGRLRQEPGKITGQEASRSFGDCDPALVKSELV